MSKFEVAAFRYADDFQYQDGDTMPRAERRAWVAALEYAKLMGLLETAARVDFAVFCDKRTDLDGAWNEWPGWVPEEVPEDDLEAM